MKCTLVHNISSNKISSLHFAHQTLFYILIARPQIIIIIEQQRVQYILTHSYIVNLYLLFDQGLLWLYDEILHYTNIII